MSRKPMGIYIKGMELPPVGRILLVLPSGRVLECSADKTQIIYSEAEAIPVPKHGRLIDKKTVSENLAKVLNDKNPPFSYPDWNDAIVAMLTAPTIIPAEEEP